MRARRPWVTSRSQVTCLIVALALAGCTDAVSDRDSRTSGRTMTTRQAQSMRHTPSSIDHEDLPEHADTRAPDVAISWYTKVLVVTFLVGGVVATPLDRIRRRAANKRQRTVDETISIEMEHNPVVGVAHAVNRGYSTVDDLIAACCQSTHAASWAPRNTLVVLAAGVRQTLPDVHGIKDVNSSRRLLLDGDFYRVSTSELRERLRDALSVFADPVRWRALKDTLNDRAANHMESTSVR